MGSLNWASGLIPLGHLHLRCDSILNVIADCLSRPNQPIMTEWSLHPEVLNLIFRLWGTPVVDRFATVHNKHLPQFMALVLDPHSRLSVDYLLRFFQYRRDLLSQQGYISSGKSYHLHHGGSYAALPSSRIIKGGI